MAKTKNPTKPTTTKTHHKPPKPENAPTPPPQQPSWPLVKILLTCKQPPPPIEQENIKTKSKKMKCSGSLCSNTKVMQKPSPSPSSSSTSPQLLNKRPSSMPLKELNNASFSSFSSSSTSSTSTSLFVTSTSPSSSGSSGPFRGMGLSRFSGCYECKMVVDPVLGVAKDISLRSTLCSCPECGDTFMKSEHLELHQAVQHAVSELGPEDTSKNIVEIIFQSSWLKKHPPLCKIDRILKIHNTPKTISKFEEYRETIKSKATKLPKKNPRCVADGNELLRFHSTTFLCSIGLDGSSNICNSVRTCNVCGIIKNGFKVIGKGICTTATSGKAHDNAGVFFEGDEKRAMLVCRVIAGRVKRGVEGSVEEYDSVAGGVPGVYSNVDELYVFNPKAILPCFVVIYRGF